MEITGLTHSQAEILLEEHGHNQIEEGSSVHPVKILLTQLTSPLIFILIFAAAISFLLHETTDAIFIMFVVVINSFLGFYQEYKAENTLEKLKQSVSKTVRVVRDGKISTIDASLLVPGDVFLLDSGLRVPADAEVIEAEELLVNEAVLTGESEPVAKDTHSHQKEDKQVYMGTLVLEGLGKAVVTTTGSKTKFGAIAKSLAEDLNPPTPIKLELQKLSKLITVFILLIVVIIFILGFFTGINLKEIFFTAVALGVSTIPEGLIISLTVTLALGMNRLLAKRALVKNLPAAETLGDVDVLCVDKTGTLTYGNMQVADSDFVDKELALTSLAMSNNNSNFIDKAVLQFLNDTKGRSFTEKIQSKREKLFPFSSQRKYTGAFSENKLFAVGAPEVIFDFSKGELSKWKDKVTKRAKAGDRMLAVAIKDTTNGSLDRSNFKEMEFLGLVYIKDPVRESVKDSLSAIIGSGIQIKVITGDLKETAVSVLTSLGIKPKPDEIMSGTELAKVVVENKLEKVVHKIKLFYRTTPDQKLSIVKALQAQGNIVGMMGDGVNDSPALKVAEIGLVVDNATDVSKEVADLILLDSNFSTIEAAVLEGRNILKNLRKIITFLLSDSMTETVLILLALIFGYPLPLTPVLLLWINIIEDGLPSLALAFEKASPELLLTKPRKNKQRLLDKKVISLIVVVSLIKDIIFFAVYTNLINHNHDLATAQTFIFACISFSSLLFLFSAKTIDTNIWREPIFNNKVVNLSVISGIFLLLLTIYWPPLAAVLGTAPLNLADLLGIGLLSFLSLAIIELAKVFLHKFIEK